MTQPTENSTRAPMTPVTNGATGGVGHLITNAITGVVCTNHPEMAGWVVPCMTLLGGVFVGLANASRNRLAKGKGGFLDVLATAGQMLG